MQVTRAMKWNLQSLTSSGNFDYVPLTTPTNHNYQLIKSLIQKNFQYQMARYTLATSNKQHFKCKKFSPSKQRYHIALSWFIELHISLSLINSHSFFYLSNIVNFLMFSLAKWRCFFSSPSLIAHLTTNHN